MSNKIIIAITLVALTVLVTFTITYSFFSPNINEFSASTVSTSTGKLIINFSDNNPNVDFMNVLPGTYDSLEDAVLSKSFTVSGVNTTGNDSDESLKLKYNLSYVVTNNTFGDNDLGYILISNDISNGSSVSGSYTSFNKNSVVRINGVSQTINLGDGYFDKTDSDGVNHQYTLYMFYIDNGSAQDNYDSKFDGHIIISAVK